MIRGSPWVIAGLALTAALLPIAWIVWRRRGVADGLRVLAIAIVPAGLAMSGLGTMFGRMGQAVGRFFVGFAFSPFVWTGFLLLGGAVALELTSRAMRSRGMGTPEGKTSGTGAVERGADARQVERSRSAGSPAAVDDDLADIEELLRRRGIT